MVCGEKKIIFFYFALISIKFDLEICEQIVLPVCTYRILRIAILCVNIIFFIGHDGT